MLQGLQNISIYGGEEQLPIINRQISDEQIISAFIENLDKRETTKRSYRNAIRQFFRYVNKTGRQLDSLTRKDIIDFKNYLLDERSRHSALTVSAYLAGIKQFYKWAEAEKLYPNIASGVSLPQNREYYIKEHLTKEECLKLFSYLENVEYSKQRKHFFANAKELQLRNLAIIYLMVWTGLRTIEVCRLNIEDITFKSGVRILRVWGKGHDRKDDFVTLPADVLSKINAYLETRPGAQPSEPLFVNGGYGEGGEKGIRRLTPRRVQQICKDSLRGIGLDDHAYSAHSLRHTTAVQILLNGGDMYDVFYTLRHVDPAVSQKYVKSIEAERRLHSAPDKYLKKAFSPDKQESDNA